MPKKSGKKKKEQQGALTRTPDEVQLTQSSSGAASSVGSQTRTVNQPSSNPPQRDDAQGFEQSREPPCQEQQQLRQQLPLRQQQSLKPSVVQHQQNQALAVPPPAVQQRAPLGQGRGTSRGRGEGIGLGIGRGRSLNLLPPQQQQSLSASQGDQRPGGRGRSGTFQLSQQSVQPSYSHPIPQGISQVPQQRETVPMQKPFLSAQEQPRPQISSFTQALQKSQVSTKQKVVAVENITQTLSEVSLQPKQYAPLPQASISVDVRNIPKRKDVYKAGTLGTKISVLTNMMRIIFGPEFRPDVKHYDVSIVPDRPKYLMRDVFFKAQNEIFPNRHPAFDGKKNVYSAGLLPFGDTATVKVTVPNENGIDKQFEVTFKKAADLDLSWLTAVRPGLDETIMKQHDIQALDIILRMAPSLKATPVGRSFFTQQDRPKSLGKGMDCWVGLFQSAILGWKPFLNVDVAHKGFPTPQSVLDLIKEICDCDDRGLTFNVIEQYKKDINQFLKGLKIAYQIGNDKKTKRIQRANELVTCPRYNSFEHNGHKISVEQYYSLEKEYEIKYPLLHCLWVGNREKNIHVPLELCEIVGGQVTQKKLDEKQVSQMIRHAATGTEKRKEKIMETFGKMGYNDDPCLKEFGISVSGIFEKVPARVLDPPVLAYQDKPAYAKKGEWRAGKFLEPSQEIFADNSWTILNLDRRTQDSTLFDVFEQLKKIGKELGITIGKPFTPFQQLQIRGHDTRELDSYFKCHKRQNRKLIIVIIPNDKSSYYKVKQIAELRVGILTQCWKAETVKKRLNAATITNILLKVNAKLGGFNHQIAALPQQKINKILPFCLEEPCMIVGADVTHPSPDAKDIPSIAAVVASHDPLALFKYNPEVRLQPPKEEIILNLAEIMEIQLKFFYERSGYWPRRIIYYRDGVGEGYFEKVLQRELLAIRAACKAVRKLVGYEYEPKITFLVVQKRHHIRLFPTDSKDSDDAHRNFNVKAGTVVDTEITHPNHIDFLMVSHASIQGTARPTKYRCLWDESDMSQDDLEQLTYFLCHMYTRCTRSVSYPTPTYYAHWAAYRARVHIQDVRIDLNNLDLEQRKLDLKGDLRKNFPMFFV